MEADILIDQYLCCFNRNVNDQFINTLERDKQKIKASPNVYIFKTRNIYETDADTYNKLLTENETKTYK